MEYESAPKRKEILTPWMNLEGVMLSEISRSGTRLWDSTRVRDPERPSSRRRNVEWWTPGPEDGAGESSPRACRVSVWECASCHRAAHLKMAKMVRSRYVSLLPRLKESRGGFDPSGWPGSGLWVADLIARTSGCGKIAPRRASCIRLSLRRRQPRASGRCRLGPLLPFTRPWTGATAQGGSSASGPMVRLHHLWSSHVLGPLFSLCCPRGGGGGACIPT